MTESRTNQLPLAYATAASGSGRRRSRLALAAFLVAFVIAPAGLMLVALAAQRNLLSHDLLCPGCGGWGATLMVAATATLLIGCIATLIHTIRLPGRFSSILLSALAVTSAAGQVLLSIAFYQLIQM